MTKKQPKSLPFTFKTPHLVNSNFFENELMNVRIMAIFRVNTPRSPNLNPANQTSGGSR
jgi:hypothetical protein